VALAVGLLLALGRGWADHGDKAPPAETDRPTKKDAPAPAGPPPGLMYSSPLPVAPPDVQGFLVAPLPLPDAAPPGPLAPVVRGAEPPMMSDFFPQFSQVNARQRVTINIPTTRAPGLGLLTQANLAAVVHAPFAAGSAWQVADNEGPRPLDRVFVTFAFFRGPTLPATPLDGFQGLSGFGAPLGGSSFGPGGQRAVTFLQQIGSTPAFQPGYQRYVQAALAGGNFVLPGPDLVGGALILRNAAGNNFLTPLNRALLTARSSDAQFQALVSGVLVQSGLASVPIAGLKVFNRPFDRSDAAQLRTDPTNLYREVFGFEKTFLDGNASVGLRMPVFQLHGDQALGLEGVGDLTALFKYALYNDRAGGNLLSVGLAVTAPTGPNVVPVPGGNPLHPTLLQPFVGGTWHYERFYAQGFSSLLVPTDQRDATLLFDDLAIGYHLYSNPASDVLTGIIPSLEAHVSTPLTHRGLNAPFVGALDAVVLTGGLHLTFGRLCLTVGAATPLTGPHATDFGGFAQVNFVF
jgi:hypothetical protein